jgi:hypothetical protein
MFIIAPGQLGPLRLVAYQMSKSKLVKFLTGSMTPDEDIENQFMIHDMNDDEDLTAKIFYESIRDKHCTG